MTEGYGWGGVDTYDQPNLDAWWISGWTAQNMAYSVAGNEANSPFGDAPSISYVGIIHQYFDGDSSPLGGFLTFMPSEGASLTQSGTTWRIPARLSGTSTLSPYYTGWGWRMDQSGRIYIRRGEMYVSLMPTDLTGLTTDSGNDLYYTVTEHMLGGRKFNISVPSADAGTTVDLDSLMISGSQMPYTFDPAYPLGDENQLDNIPDPTVPTGLSATEVSGAVQLSWSAPASVMPLVSYKINRSNTSGAQSPYQTISSGYTSFLDSAVTAGDTYYYNVQAVNTLGNYSSPSTQASITVS